MTAEVPYLNLFRAGSIKAKVDLNRLLMKYLGAEQKTALVTRAGKCDVCGRVHRSEKEWKRCASERKSGRSHLFVRDHVFPNYIPKYSIYLRVEVDDVLICVFPGEKIPDAEKEVDDFLDRTVEALKRKLAQAYRDKVISYLDEVFLLDVDPSKIMKGSPEDVLYSALIFMMLEDPDLLRIKRAYPRIDLGRDLESELEEVGISPFRLAEGLMGWLCDKMRDRVEGYINCDRSNLVKVDYERRVGFLAINIGIRSEERLIKLNLNNYEILGVYKGKEAMDLF